MIMTHVPLEIQSSILL